MSEHEEESIEVQQSDEEHTFNTAAILSGLNEAQRAAVTAEASVVQVLAPPGSGKTKTLTSRVAYQLTHFGYRPWNVLCMTFTIKSAREMKERIAKLVGNGLESKIVLGTFHSVCRRYLVQYGHLIGLRKTFGIADSSDSTNILKRILKELKVSIDLRVARSRISKTKARYSGYEEVLSETARKTARKIDQQEFLLVFEAYQAHLERSNLLDYDDLLLRTVELLRQHPECVANVEAVLVDEFQDTNSVQFDLLQLFASKRQRVTTVGDPDQSIYGWRSAEVKNLSKMRRLYPETLVLNLEDNYRSSGAILAAALDVIEQDESRPAKPLQPTHCRGTRPIFRKLASSKIEAAWIVTEIKRCMALTGGLFKPSDFAILLRSATLSREIESCMGKAGLPYRMVGGLRFFDRIEVKILVNYLRVIAHPDNTEAFVAIINLPKRQIGDTTLKTLLEGAQSMKMSLFSFARAELQGRTFKAIKMSKAAEQGLAALVNLIVTARSKILEDRDFYPDQILAYVMKRINFKEYLGREGPEEYEARWANAEELLAQAADPAFTSERKVDEDELPVVEGVQQQYNAAQTEEALTKFLANLALSTELQEENENGSNPQERVTISTMHAAKGLEWPVVFVPAAYKGSIPHSRNEDCDEERRLLYVAMTRAQALLYISWPFRNATTSDETLQCSFLPDNIIDNHFADKGPVLDFGDIESIANILRREQPPGESIASARLSADQPEDDLWPTDGGSWHLDNRRDIDELEVKYSLSRKKRKVDDTRSSSVIGAATPSTSQHASGLAFECRNTGTADTTGFVTAAMHLTSTENLIAKERTQAKRRTVTERARENNERNKQATIMGLWGRKDSTSTPYSAQSEATPLQEVNVNAAFSRNVFQYNQPRSFKDPVAGGAKPALTGATLPPLNSHSVSRTGLQRPKISTEEKVAANYVYLSNSPPPDSRPGSCGAKEAENGRFDTHVMEGRETAVNLQTSYTSTVHGIGGDPCAALQQPASHFMQASAATHSVHSTTATLPSTTFHNTSMAQLHTGSGSTVGSMGGPRRTLGVKRSLTGWTPSSAGMRPFRPPGLPGARST